MAIDADDRYELSRFVEAQENSYPQALSELRAGRKRSHWMWYVFPQLAGLGNSSMSVTYAIKSEGEARAYLDHPVLGPRLIECAKAVISITGKSAHDIFGSPDDLKLQSSATLFEHVSSPGSVFGKLLTKYHSSERDQRTLDLLGVAQLKP